MRRPPPTRRRARFDFDPSWSADGRWITWARLYPDRSSQGLLFGSIHAGRADTSDVDNIAAWMTTVVSRVCLTMLDARRRRREEALEAGRLPDPVITLPEIGRAHV